MSNKFWSMLVDFKVAERYYWYYTNDSRKWDDLISGICLLTSATSISTWYIWNKFPVLWAILIALAQIVSVLKPLFPFYSRRIAARYIYQDISALCIEAEYIWGTVDSNANETLERHLLEFTKRYADIENRFSTPDLFPAKPKLHAKAQKDATTYFTVRYQTEVEGDV